MSTLTPIQRPFTAVVPQGAIPGPGPEPIIDLRPSLGWRTRLPARLLTAGLWGVGLYLAAMPLGRLPANLAMAAAVSSLTGLPLVGLVALRSGRSAQPAQDKGTTGNPALAAGPAATSGDALHRDPPRQQLAALVGIDEASLFRGRHARICTVHHNSAGELIAIQPSQPKLGIRLPSRDAHPVG